MAKTTSKNRQRRGVSSSSPRSYSELLRKQEKTDAVSVAAAKPAPAPVSTARGSDKVDWKGEYARTIADVRQLLLISALLFVVMIVLGIVI